MGSHEHPSSPFTRSTPKNAVILSERSESKHLRLLFGLFNRRPTGSKNALCPIHRFFLAMSGKSRTSIRPVHKEHSQKCCHPERAQRVEGSAFAFRNLKGSPFAASPAQAQFHLQRISRAGFVSGHDFNRAENRQNKGVLTPAGCPVPPPKAPLKKLSPRASGANRKHALSLPKGTCFPIVLCKYSFYGFLQISVFLSEVEGPASL